jgi:molybdenum cofactor cytidylyltransferase
MRGGRPAEAGGQREVDRIPAWRAVTSRPAEDTTRPSSTAPTDLALLLAAGASTRFSGRPKALLPLDREPAVSRMVRICQRNGFFPRVVVGRHGPAIREALEGSGADVVENTAWAEGRTGSVQVGLDAGGNWSTVLLWPVDHPFVQAMTLRRLRSAAVRETMGVWFIPTFEARGGHPVLLTAAALGRVRDLGRSEPLRSLLPGFGPQVVRVPVDDAGVTANVDTPAEFQRFLSLAQREENGR